MGRCRRAGPTLTLLPRTIGIRRTQLPRNSRYPLLLVAIVQLEHDREPPKPNAHSQSSSLSVSP